ncbi:RNA polymerase factor sigma-54 [Sulfurihydrogenibium azorense]|uniref:RNA polymerase factor sigma-54 n=1 Tax=Sulfurihydrogenibium azorense TaxID=309806 RepID=UPI00240A78A0|nr:RNA polymerase factor sigma-54 [Sulfurihydrogenibium azorense]MDM7273674.1 RNA polymerase factor sigma-54 [Sulfurihydrogenibium azorense]
MKQGLSLKLQNKLKLTLSLKQQLNIITLPKSELIQEINRELEENPFLEEISHIQPDLNLEKVEFGSYYEEDEEKDPFYKLTYKPSLYDILQTQIDIEFDGLEKEIATQIVENVDEKGYISQDTLKEISQRLSVDLNTIERVRKKVMSLEPTGIGSLNFKEFLYQEYKDRYGKDKIAQEIIENDLEKINDKEYLKQKYEMTDYEVEEILENIKSLRPYPLYGYEDFEITYVEPDIFLHFTNDPEKPFKVQVNDEGIPKINLVSQYKKVLNQKNLSEEAKKFLYEKLQKAVGLINGIEQRRENLKKLAEFLVDYQKDFILNGKEYLKPLTLKDVSRQVGLHESTISRLVNSKYIQAPFGVIPLKLFFSNKASKESGNISSDRVKYLIRDLIEKEDPTKPYSDNEIVELLKNQGIKVARRTVTKYREEMNIPDSRKRKKI